MQEKFSNGRPLSYSLFYHIWWMTDRLHPSPRLPSAFTFTPPHLPSQQPWCIHACSGSSIIIATCFPRLLPTSQSTMFPCHLCNYTQYHGSSLYRLCENWPKCWFIFPSNKTLVDRFEAALFTFLINALLLPFFTNLCKKCWLIWRLTAFLSCLSHGPKAQNYCSTPHHACCAKAHHLRMYSYFVLLFNVQGFQRETVITSFN